MLMWVPSVLGVLVVSFLLGILVALLLCGVPTADIFGVLALGCSSVKGSNTVCLSMVF